MDAEQLKPCPFCGNDTPLLTAGMGWHMHCMECGAMGPELLSGEDVATEADAIAAWNTRAALAAAPSVPSEAEVMRILADHGIGMCDGETVFPHEGDDAAQYMGAIRAIVARHAAPEAPQQEGK